MQFMQMQKLLQKQNGGEKKHKMAEEGNSIIKQEMQNIKCSICDLAQPSLKVRSCSLCQVSYHEICYFETRPRIQSDCQACTYVMKQKQHKSHEKGKKIEPHCFVCGRSDGILKLVAPNKFSHIMCILTSNGFQIQKYSEFNIKEKQNVMRSKCTQCRQSSPHIIQCQLCQTKCHFGCLKLEQQYVGQKLEQNLKFNKLLRVILNWKLASEPLKLILECIPDWSSYKSGYNRIMACTKQFKKYCWCFCADASLNDEESNPSIVCDGCNRYVHLSCSGLKNENQEKLYYCPGCKNGDRYKRNAKLPQLLQDMIRLQDAKFKLSDLKLIDAFPYIYSAKLLKNIQKQQDKVIDYLAIKAIQLILTTYKQEDINLTNFYNLIKYIIGNTNNQNNQQLWNSYVDVLKRLQPTYYQAISQLKCPGFEQFEKMNKQIQEEQQVILMIIRLKQLLEKNPSLQIPNIILCISQIRQALRKTNKIREQIQSKSNNNMCLALLVFRCSQNNIQKILSILLQNYFNNTLLTPQQLQNLRSLKRKGTPNFVTETAWCLLQNNLKIQQEYYLLTNGNNQPEQSKIQCSESQQKHLGLLALGRILSSRQLNPKLFVSLKKRVNNFKRFGIKQQKIKTLYQWSTLSKKAYFGIEKKKMSIQGIELIFKQMKYSHYPKNQIHQKIQILFKEIKPIKKIIHNFQSWSLEKALALKASDFFILMNKNTIHQIKQTLLNLKETKHLQIWYDLQKYQLENILQNCELLKQKAEQILYNKKIQINENATELSRNSSDVTDICLKKQIKPKQIIFFKKQLYQYPISVISIAEYYQIAIKSATSEVLEKNNKWFTQKLTEQMNEKNLMEDLLRVISKIKQTKQKFNDVQLRDLLENKQLQQQVLNQFKNIDQTKIQYLCKHLKRNKKWLEDLNHLKNGTLKFITYEQVCCLQFKLKTSIFNHNKLIQECIIPLKKQTLEIKQQLQQIMPYGKQIQHSISLKQNVYNPQSKFYKKVRQLQSKDFVLRLYQKDCETLKNLIIFQNKINKKGKQIVKNLIYEFEDIYKQISPYLHEAKNVWDIIFKILTKIIQLYRQQKSFLEKIQKKYILNKAKKLIEIVEKVVQIGGVMDNTIKIEEIKSRLQQEYRNIKEIQFDDV